MALTAAPRPALHLPRPAPEDAIDDKALKRAARLGAVASAVDALDMKAIAETYKQNVGGSELEAAAVAASALGAAVATALGGGPIGPEEAKRAAELEVQKAAKQKARELQGVQKMMQRAEEEGPVGEVKRELAREQLAMRAEKAVAEKEERIHADAATRRAMREERQAAAASRRCISEARAFLRMPRKSDPNEWPSLPLAPEGAPDGSPGLDLAMQDPALRRAKSLVGHASRVMASLDEQNQMLRRKASGLPEAGKQIVRSQPPSPPRVTPGSGAAARAAAAAAEEEALLAKAKELLADYKPPEQQRRASVPGHKVQSPAHRSELPRRGPHQVNVEIQRRRFKL